VTTNTTSPFGGRPPRELRRQITNLSEFRSAYVEYLNDTLQATLNGAPVSHSAERTKVLRLATRAGSAVDIAGVLVAVSAPPAAGPRPPLVGLVPVAFAHEDPMYRSFVLPGEAPRQSFDYALDAVDSALEKLVTRLEEEKRRRRNPLYWADRGLRAILGFPAYLISLVFGFDRRALRPSASRALWLLSVAADAAGLWALGRQLGWW
jgi:hypothetical protein